MKIIFASAVFILSGAANAANILISDTRDAFDRVTAMKGLLQQVDARIQAIQSGYERAAAPLSAELEQLRKPGQTGQNQQRKATLLLQIAGLQKKASLAQQAVGAENEKALAQIDTAISAIESELKKERKADAVLRAQDTLYFNTQCACNITDEIYKRLNVRLPSLALPKK
jgi:Skp family chaperone for outer membrane proteins